jgi:hypothetical protein
LSHQPSAGTAAAEACPGSPNRALAAEPVVPRPPLTPSLSPVHLGSQPEGS